MRVIAGKYRHINLVAPEGKNVTRPTLDRIKEAMFNILNIKVMDSIVVDLFSGSGALGIEALSRGAKFVYFNDLDKEANRCILTNLKTIKVNSSDYELIKLNYLDCLNYLKEKNIKIDILLLDPPYLNNIYEEIISYCLENELLNNNAKVVIETLYSNKVNLDEFNYREYKYGEKKLLVVNINK